MKLTSNGNQYFFYSNGQVILYKKSYKTETVPKHMDFCMYSIFLENFSKHIHEGIRHGKS